MHVHKLYVILLYVRTYVVLMKLMHLMIMQPMYVGTSVTLTRKYKSNTTTTTTTTTTTNNAPTKIIDKSVDEHEASTNSTSNDRIDKPDDDTATNSTSSDGIDKPDGDAATNSTSNGDTSKGPGRMDNDFACEVASKFSTGKITGYTFAKIV